MADPRKPDHVPTIMGALLVLAGAQVPSLVLSGWGSVSYADIGGTPAILMQAAAVVGLLAVFARRPTLLRAAAVGLWVALFWPLLRFGTERLMQSDPDNEFKRIGQDVAQAVADGVTRAAGDFVPQIVSLRWGLLVLFAGCVLVTRGAFRRGA